MATLHHHPFCPHSRFIRLALAEMGLTPDFSETRPWERRPEFLAMNPTGATPVLVEPAGLVVPGGGVIAEYLDETRGHGLNGRRLLPESAGQRVAEASGHANAETASARMSRCQAGELGGEERIAAGRFVDAHEFRTWQLQRETVDEQAV